MFLKNTCQTIRRELFRHYYNGKEPKDEKSPKLILNLKDKDRYVVHIRTLKFYLEKGMKVKQYHSIIKFQQRAWLKPYIDFNIGQAKSCEEWFWEDLFKLMNNAVYWENDGEREKSYGLWVGE